MTKTLERRLCGFETFLRPAANAQHPTASSTRMFMIASTRLKPQSGSFRFESGPLPFDLARIIFMSGPIKLSSGWFNI